MQVFDHIQNAHVYLIFKEDSKKGGITDTFEPLYLSPEGEFEVHLQKLKKQVQDKFSEEMVVKN